MPLIESNPYNDLVSINVTSLEFAFGQGRDVLNREIEKALNGLSEQRKINPIEWEKYLKLRKESRSESPVSLEVERELRKHPLFASVQSIEELIGLINQSVSLARENNQPYSPLAQSFRNFRDELSN